MKRRRRMLKQCKTMFFSILAAACKIDIHVGEDISFQNDATKLYLQFLHTVLTP